MLMNEIKKYWGKNAAGLIVYCGRNILLCLRSAEVQNPYLWAYPGGKMDDEDKNFKEAAVREFKEETKFNDVLYGIKEIHTFKDAHFTYKTFIAKVKKKFKPTLNWENDEYGWFDIDELPRPLLKDSVAALESTKAILQHF